ncbi:MAG: YggS family pyridoxal phosphate-dependent enzyme, partial [Planctomycetota bacterium]
MSESEHDTRIAENWAAVQEDVEQALKASGRTNDDLKIVGVSKYVELPETKMLVDAGCRTLGESRPQVLWSKRESGEIPSEVQWHLIGHLQRN